MKWFTFQFIILHAANNIECPEDYLKSLLKVFSMFNVRIIYYETIDNEDVPEVVGIMCINCGKSIVFLLDNRKIEHLFTPFVTKMVFQNIGLFCIIHSTKNLNCDFQKHCLFWILNYP